jgi:TetR/AcrR family transcriptional regulator, transcriptional repressor for nem operon
MTRTKPPEQRRAELLAAGRELFLAKGIAATSLDDITHRAGVSKGLFYLYFRSKEDLVLALQEQFSCQFAACMRDAADVAAGWGGKLDACVRASFECYHNLHDLHEVLFHHGHPVHDSHNGGGGDRDRHEPSHAAATAVFEELFAAGTSAGAFDVADPAATAVLCYASMHAFDCRFRGGAGPDDLRLIRAAQQLFRRAAGLPAGNTDTMGNAVITVGAAAGNVADTVPPAAPDAPA